MSLTSPRPWRRLSQPFPPKPWDTCLPTACSSHDPLPWIISTRLHCRPNILHRHATLISSSRSPSRSLAYPCAECPLILAYTSGRDPARRTNTLDEVLTVRAGVRPAGCKAVQGCKHSMPGIAEQAAAMPWHCRIRNAAYPEMARHCRSGAWTLLEGH